MNLWRSSRTFRGCTITLAILLLVFAAPWLYLDWRMKRDVEETFARLEAAGYPMSLNELAPGPVPDDQNAAVLYQQVFRVDFETGENDNAFSKITGSAAVYDYYSGDIGPAAVRPVLTSPRAQQALDLLRRGSLRAECAFPIDWDQHQLIRFPHYAQFREAARWLSAAAKLDANDGRLDDAAEWTETSLRMSEHLAREPVLIGQLVVIALHAIALEGAEQAFSDQPAPSPEAVHDLQQLIRSIDLERSMKRAMRGEAAIRVDMARDVVANNETAREMLASLASNSYLSDRHSRVLSLYPHPIMRPMRNADAVACLQEAEQSFLAAEGKPRTRQPPAHKMPGLLGEIGIPGTLPLVRMISYLGYYDKAWEKVTFTQTHLELLDIALELKLYKARHGQYPATLAEIEPTFGRALPEDPYANAPLIYRREGEGFVLYSFGQDGDDDGGLDRDDPLFKYYDNMDITWKTTR
jgi:hypothetical protein